MAVWKTSPALAERSDLTADFAHAWRAADKVVYSRTLTGVSTSSSRLERDFDPVAVQALKAAAASLLIGGADSPPAPSPQAWSTSANIGPWGRSSGIG